MTLLLHYLLIFSNLQFNTDLFVLTCNSDWRYFGPNMFHNVYTLYEIDVLSYYIDLVTFPQKRVI